MRGQHRGELPQPRLVGGVAACRALRFEVGGGEIALPASGRGNLEVGHVVGETHARFRRRIDLRFRARRQQCGFDHRPQRGQARVFVLQRGHRDQVVQGEQARVLDARGERVLRQQCGARRGHAVVQQLGFEAFLHRGGVRAGQQERQHPQCAAAQSGFGHERQRHAAFRVRAEGEDACAGRDRARRARVQFAEPAVQRPTRAQGLGWVEMRGGEHEVALRCPWRDPREVVGQAFGQGHGRVGGEGIDADRAVGEFQREQAGGGGVVVVHGLGVVIGRTRARR